MNFWEAYQKMLQGIWCQKDGEKFPYSIYRFANNRWECVSSEPYGQGIWDGKHFDEHPFDYFIKEVEQWEYSNDPINWSNDDIDSNWHEVDCTSIKRIEDRVGPFASPEKIAIDDKEERELEEYNRLHPPIIVSITKEDIFRDRTSEFMESIRSFAFGTN